MSCNGPELPRVRRVASRERASERDMMASAAAPLEQSRSITKQASQEKRASIAMQRERRATSQEGKGRDFRVATFIHLFVAGTIGPNEAKKTSALSARNLGIKCDRERLCSGPRPTGHASNS